MFEKWGTFLLSVCAFCIKVGKIPSCKCVLSNSRGHETAVPGFAAAVVMQIELNRKGRALLAPFWSGLISQLIGL